MNQKYSFIIQNMVALSVYIILGKVSHGEHMEVLPEGGEELNHLATIQLDFRQYGLHELVRLLDTMEG